ncbi:MAG TPA: DMT family transporter [Acidimicrobiales bacterium]|nr:DMT family transporter [Acidimicrobiales bacterium]
MLVYLLALAAALANALTSVLQRMGVEDAPATDTLKLSLLAHALRRKVWLAGFGVMAVSFVLQAVALHFGRLTEVQPIMTTELLFLVLILGTWFRFTVGWREWVGATAAAAGLAGFLWFASPKGGELVPGPAEWAEVGGACLGVMVISVALALRGARWWRSAMFGIAAAVAYAFTAALTKTVTGFVSSDWLSVFRHWQTYGLAISGLLALFLTQNAYHAGPIAASQSTLVLVDPLASILIGINLFGDNLRTAGAWGPLEALSLLVLFGGALLLCHSPLVSGVKGEDPADSELLSERSRHRHVDGLGDPTMPIQPNT